VLIIKESLRSRRAGFLTVLGNETGVFVRGVVAALGSTALPVASEPAHDVMRIVGAVVLVAFGVQTLRQARRAKGDPAPGPGEAAGKSGWASYRGGLLLNLAHPKAAIFAMSFLPQFVPEGAPRLPWGHRPRPRRAVGGLRQCIGLQAGCEANLTVVARSVADSGPVMPDTAVLRLRGGASRECSRRSWWWLHRPVLLFVYCLTTVSGAPPTVPAK
jgi:hypothetical protein